VASLCKKCRCGRAQWDSCDHVWLIRSRDRSGKEVYANAGHERPRAERLLRDSERVNRETVSEAIDIWLADKRNDPAARANSIYSYESRRKHIDDAFAGVPVRDVRPEDILEFCRRQRAVRKPATVHGIYAVLTGALKHAQARGVIHQLPVPPQGPGIPTPEARVHDIKVEQLWDVIDHLVHPWNLVAELCLLTGLRWGEAVALTEEDVTEGLIQVRRTRTRSGLSNRPKTKAGERAVPLERRSQEILDVLELPVVGTYRDALRALHAALGDLRRPGMGWHVFRAAHIEMLSQKVSLREAAARVGHGANFAQTLAYRLDARTFNPVELAGLLRPHPAPPSPESPSVDELAARRLRRSAGQREAP
jgi:integrase